MALAQARREKQSTQKQWNDLQISPRGFEPGQHNLLLLPSAHNKLRIKWQGPYRVLRQVGEVDYKIQFPRKRSNLFHVNLLKAWQGQEETAQYGVEW